MTITDSVTQQPCNCGALEDIRAPPSSSSLPIGRGDIPFMPPASFQASPTTLFCSICYSHVELGFWKHHLISPPLLFFHLASPTRLRSLRTETHFSGLCPGSFDDCLPGRPPTTAPPSKSGESAHHSICPDLPWSTEGGRSDPGPVLELDLKRPPPYPLGSQLPHKQQRADPGRETEASDLGLGGALHPSAPSNHSGAEMSRPHWALPEFLTCTTWKLFQKGC